MSKCKNLGKLDFEWRKYTRTVLENKTPKTKSLIVEELELVVAKFEIFWIENWILRWEIELLERRLSKSKIAATLGNWIVVLENRPPKTKSLIIEELELVVTKSEIFWIKNWILRLEIELLKRRLWKSKNRDKIGFRVAEIYTDPLGV